MNHHDVELVEDGEDVVLPIPDEILDQLGWDDGDMLEWSIDGDSIIITKVEESDGLSSVVKQVDNRI